MALHQPAHYDETWSDERIQSWLGRAGASGESSDFSVLWRAYQGMRPYDFERFMQLYSAAGHDVNARSLLGETLTGIVSRHARGGVFLQILKDAGGSV